MYYNPYSQIGDGVMRWLILMDDSKICIQKTSKRQTVINNSQVCSQLQPSVDHFRRSMQFSYIPFFYCPTISYNSVICHVQHLIKWLHVGPPKSWWTYLRMMLPVFSNLENNEWYVYVHMDAPPTLLHLMSCQCCHDQGFSDLSLGTLRTAAALW